MEFNTLCEYEVSDKRRLVWKAQIDMLNIVKNICDGHQLKYYAICGTLLGAVRHDGFIPWDDDIDLGMFREDYDKFIEVCKSELSYPYILQLPGEEDGYYYGHAKIRNSETTAIRKCNWKTGKKFNQGIFIDIFPIDNIPDGKHKRKMFLKTINKLHSIQKYVEYWFFEQDNPNKKQILKYHLYNFFIKIYGGPDLFYKRYDSIVQKYNSEKTKQVGIISEFIFSRFLWNKADFLETEEHVFEDSLITIPTHFDAILTKSYGIWNKEVMNGELHGDVFYDTQKPYIYYIDKYNLYKDDEFYEL